MISPLPPSSQAQAASSSPVTAGLSIDGYLIFEIPTNITTAQLKYGDYVTINIKPSDIKSK